MYYLFYDIESDDFLVAQRDKKSNFKVLVFKKKFNAESGIHYLNMYKFKHPKVVLKVLKNYNTNKDHYWIPYYNIINFEKSVYNSALGQFDKITFANNFKQVACANNIQDLYKTIVNEYSIISQYVKTTRSIKNI